jgi:hypothetical protein
MKILKYALIIDIMHYKTLMTVHSMIDAHLKNAVSLNGKDDIWVIFTDSNVATKSLTMLSLLHLHMHCTYYKLQLWRLGYMYSYIIML